MNTLMTIVVAAVCLWLLGRVIGSARSNSWAGPRTPQMRTRAAAAATRPRGPGPERRALRAMGRSARPLGTMALHPTNRMIRTQAAADIEREWQKAFATDYLEQQRHARQNGTANGQVPAEPGPSRRWVPDHEASPQGRIRSPAVKVLAATGAWKLLPGRAQGALCGCAACQGKKPHEPAANGNGQPVNGTTSGTQPGQGNGGPPARPSPPPAPSQSVSNGGTPVAAGTSTASAEKLIEGINEIHAHAASGGINAKREAVKDIHEGFVRFGAMLAMLSRQMSEPGQNYGPEITEPLAQSGTHAQAGAMAASESDAALSTLINMTVGDLAASPRQAPHHAELSEAGAR